MRSVVKVKENNLPDISLSLEQYYLNSILLVLNFSLFYISAPKFKILEKKIHYLSDEYSYSKSKGTCKRFLFQREALFRFEH